MVDTHAHIYAEEFDDDIDAVITRAKESGISSIILPNVDSESLPRMQNLAINHPDFCYPAIGLHPTSVKDNFEEELEIVHREIKKGGYIAVGEIGIDLYWDKSFLKQQIHAFQNQIQLAIEHDLPVIIHVRDSFEETIAAMEPFRKSGLSGVFHSFTGSVQQAEKMLEFNNFYLGINGIVTFKNSGLCDTLKNININKILLETDAPYLTPVPYRGKRNESGYVRYVAQKLSEIYELPVSEINEITSLNAGKLFRGIKLLQNYTSK